MTFSFSADPSTPARDILRTTQRYQDGVQHADPGEIASLHHLGLRCLNRNDLRHGSRAGDRSRAAKMLLA